MTVHSWTAVCYCDCCVHDQNPHDRNAVRCYSSKGYSKTNKREKAETYYWAVKIVFWQVIVDYIKGWAYICDDKKIFLSVSDTHGGLGVPLSKGSNQQFMHHIKPYIVGYQKNISRNVFSSIYGFTNWSLNRLDISKHNMYVCMISNYLEMLQKIGFSWCLFWSLTGMFSICCCVKFLCELPVIEVKWGWSPRGQDCW